MAIHDDERHEWAGASDRAAMMRRFQARNAQRCEEAMRDESAIEALRRRNEAERIEELRVMFADPQRLAHQQRNAWAEFMRAYEAHRPAFIRLSLGDKAEATARQTLQPFTWRDDDPRHPDGSIVLSGTRAGEGIGVRAFFNEAVQQAVYDWLLTASWFPQESRRPPQPPPPTIEEMLARQAIEREARAAARRKPDYNWQLIVKGGRGW